MRAVPLVLRLADLHQVLHRPHGCQLFARCALDQTHAQEVGFGLLADRVLLFVHRRGESA